MKARPIDELCELLGVANTKEFTKKFGVANGTLSNLNTGKSSRALKFLLRLSLECLRELSAKKRIKISQLMRKNT